jgi:murein DD-endopeptidase MepM/ murein hydrolase activator NlpD
MFRFSRKHLPFLHRIFPSGVYPAIVEGWIYGQEETKVYGGYDAHQGVDFAVPTGTPVLAAADGLALASFEEVPIRYPGSDVRTLDGEPIFWGLGLFVLILHKNGLVTYYGHLHRLADSLQAAYCMPQVSPGAVMPPHIGLDRKDFRRYGAIRIPAGEVIGQSGITGMGRGTRTYDNWLRRKPYTVNDEEHVHFAISSLPALSTEAVYIDPFAIHAYAPSYPSYADNWSRLPGSLWLA